MTSRANPTVVRRVMTDDERRMARALTPGHVSYVPGSADKRFAYTLAAIAQGTDPMITVRQAAHLRRLVWRYRRQLSAEVRAFVPEKPAGYPFSGARP